MTVCCPPRGLPLGFCPPQRSQGDSLCMVSWIGCVCFRSGEVSGRVRPWNYTGGRGSVLHALWPGAGERSLSSGRPPGAPRLTCISLALSLRRSTVTWVCPLRPLSAGVCCHRTWRGQRPCPLGLCSGWCEAGTMWSACADDPPTGLRLSVTIGRNGWSQKRSRFPAQYLRSDIKGRKKFCWLLISYLG